MQHIKGFQPVSLVDYPGNIAAIVFLGGCNFRCHYCHNPELVLTPGKMESIDKELVMRYLDKRKNMLDGVVITGGEPCLYPGLIDFIMEIKSLGLKVKLDTNGTRPKVLKEALVLVDYVAMDIKTDITSYEKPCGIKVDKDSIKESVQLIRDYAKIYEFRTTMVRGYVSQEDVKGICSWLKGSKKYALQQFNKEGPVLNDDVKKEILYTKEELFSMAKYCEDYFEVVEVRNI